MTTAILFEVSAGTRTSPSHTSEALTAKTQSTKAAVSDTMIEMTIAFANVYVD